MSPGIIDRISLVMEQLMYMVVGEKIKPVFFNAQKRATVLIHK
jgi:hypothetical protein